MTIPPGKAWALSAASGIAAALTGCAASPRGTVAAAELPEYPPAQGKPGVTQVAADKERSRPQARGGEVASPADGAQNCCKGHNDCKGKGNCKTDQNACKGMNQCKGKGGCRDLNCP